MKQLYPNIDPRLLQKGDVIKVNVRRIINDKRLKSDIDKIIAISSVIVHEATHEEEVRKTGYTSESGPKLAEREFINFLHKPEIIAEIQQALQKYSLLQPHI